MTTFGFNVAESQIFSRGATYRLMPGLEHLRFNSIDMLENDVIVSTIEGDVVQSRDVYIEHFLEYRQRLPNFFEYVGPKYTPRTLWRHGLYVLFIGWQSLANSYITNDIVTQQALLMNEVGRRQEFIRLRDELNLPGNQLGHLVAHEGISSQPPDTILPLDQPYCTCGSFQMQLHHVEQFRDVCGSDFQPMCKHIRYMREFDKLRNVSSELAARQADERLSKTMAYLFFPPTDQTSSGTLRALYIDEQPSRPIEHWSVYNRTIHHEDVWEFFFQSIKHGYMLRHASFFSSIEKFLKTFNPSDEVSA